MRMFKLPTAALDRFESDGTAMEFLPAAVDAAETRISIARVAAGGTIGRHPATLTQAFAVIDGAGVVAAEDDVMHAVASGVVVVWEKGEIHQTWATTPMLAVVVETSGSFELTSDHVELGEA
ncbi:hypothetical protein ET495_13185 [Xylanimonas allomyrinae]|uniref:Cupin n=1 Tax=Xylanimonas allomyrinae TaxID=2509459 RepID=A0A4P6F109_9MICO|nr:hypothetical protein [Xylanimonas allomyrinae]QAY64018.1 hypothetical protein ET495_13185 [Xylanimonas allomyrinae]